MIADAKPVDLDALRTKLLEDGYAVIEGVLTPEEVERYRDRIDTLMADEREHPYVPADGIANEDDGEIADYYRKHYTVSETEVEHLLARIRHDRTYNRSAAWPVPFAKVPKSFIHLPTTFDQDRSQRVWNLINKAPDLAPLIEHPTVLALVRHVLGEDCTLHDFQATSIGPHTGGGSWHIDAPLGQMPEPLPDFALTVQNVWLLDDFTEHNGASRVVPGSHKRRTSPPWSEGNREDERILTAPAGSIAIWLASTWHRSGPNVTEKPRRAVLCNYKRSWMNPFVDFTSLISDEAIEMLSPSARYLLGFGARAPRMR